MNATVKVTDSGSHDDAPASTWQFRDHTARRAARNLGEVDNEAHPTSLCAREVAREQDAALDRINDSSRTEPMPSI